MPRPVNPNAAVPVKRYRMTMSERRKAQRFAKSLGKSESALFLSWIEGFLKNGSDYQPDPPTVVQVVGPIDLFMKAEEKAQREYGVGVREILRYEIAQLDLL